MTSPTATAAWPALDRFDEAALDYGWLKEEGEGAEDAGLAEYEAAKEALIAEHRALLAALRAAEAERDEARAALAPFASVDVPAELDDMHSLLHAIRDGHVITGIAIGYFRDARAVLQSTSAKEGK